MKLYLLGYACGLAGADNATGQGPLVIQQSPYQAALKNIPVAFQWDQVFSAEKNHNIETAIQKINLELAKRIAVLVKEQCIFTVLGGDHTSAIGTWSGAFAAIHEQGDLGLIWIDAHMDSHTPETSESHHIHGMPLACLLGYGADRLTTLLSNKAKLKPENVCLIGVRSFERGEAELLKKLKVRIYFMDEINERGLQAILKEAAELVSQRTVAYGISLDIDGIDPIEAPGVDVPEPNGLHAEALCDGLQAISADPKLLGLEIVEFDPTKDKEQRTEKLVFSLLKAFAQGKINHHVHT